MAANREPGKEADVRESYLITGGAGFIGINAADHYLRHGCRVTVLDDFSRRGTEENVEWLLLQPHGENLQIVRADIRHDQRALADAVEDAEVCLHLAAQVAVTTSVTDPREDFEINALGTFNVLEAVRLSSSHPIVLYSSTNKVYGRMADLEIEELADRYAYAELPHGVSEDRPLDFYSPYGCSKGGGDQYVIDYARMYGLRTVVFRQSCIYGPHQFGIEDQGWVAWFAIRALLDLGVTIFGDGKQVRDVLCVDDLNAAYDAAVNHIDTVSGRAYNIGGGPANTLSLLELVALLDSAFGRRLEHEFGEWRPGDQRVFVSDIRKAMRELDWKPKVGVAEGVERMWNWLAANKGRARIRLG
jgi:CDP-paratose 2-epimerase